MMAAIRMSLDCSIAQPVGFINFIREVSAIAVAKIHLVGLKLVEERRCPVLPLSEDRSQKPMKPHTL